MRFSVKTVISGVPKENDGDSDDVRTYQQPTSLKDFNGGWWQNRNAFDGGTICKRE